MKEAVGVIIFGPRGVALRERLTPTEGRHAGFWCGAGGLREDGESFEEAAARELKEEGGVGAAVTRFVLVHENEGHTGRFPYWVKHYLLELALGEELTSPEGLEKDGPWTWMTKQEALALPLVPGMKSAVRRAVAHLKARR